MLLEFKKKAYENVIEGVRRRYPFRKIEPFFTRDDNDEIACYDADNNNTVYIIHDYASP